MEEKADVPRRSWWARRNLLCKLLLVLVPAIIVIGLAVGLGVGLTVGQGGDDDDDSNGNGSNVNTTSSVTTWQPAVNSSYQMILLNPIELPTTAKATVPPALDAWDIDMFTNEKEVMDTLHKLGSKVICYFSAGSYEPDRPDSKDFQKKDLGKELDGWPGEYWLNISSPDVRTIMSNRIAYAQSKGCDAIDPDNIDGYGNKNGLGLTQQDSVNYIEFLASEAKSRGMSCGLKNAGEIISRVLPVVAFSVNEQCHEFQECSTFAPFIKAGKPVFNLEYPDDAPKFTTADIKKYCSTSGQWGSGATDFSITLQTADLNGTVEYCNGVEYSTPVNLN